MWSKIFYIFVLPVIKAVATDFLLKLLQEIIEILQKRQDNNISELDSESIVRRIEAAKEPKADPISYPEKK